MMPSFSVDVAIVGNGVAGCATALALHQHGVGRIAIIGPKPCGQPRVGESIPPDARLLLQTLGLWEEFEQQGHEQCVGSCSIWGSIEPGYNDFMINPYGPGWHLDREQFEALLGRKVREIGVMHFVGQVRSTIHTSTQDITLQIEGSDNCRLRSPIVVDATGIHAKVARRLGAKRYYLDQLLFLCGVFDTRKAEALPMLTLLESERDGWWYAAPLPNKRLIVTLATDSEHIKQCGLRSPDHWLGQLLRTRNISRYLNGAQFLGEVFMRAAPSFLLYPVAGEDWLAVGDAASAYDPISAQGIYKALNDGIEAAIAIVEHDHVKFSSSVKSRFNSYISNRNYFYQQEGRWPDSLFWQRRSFRQSLGGITV